MFESSFNISCRQRPPLWAGLACRAPLSEGQSPQFLCVATRVTCLAPGSWGCSVPGVKKEFGSGRATNHCASLIQALVFSSIKWNPRNPYHRLARRVNSVADTGSSVAQKVITATLSFVCIPHPQLPTQSQSFRVQSMKNQKPREVSGRGLEGGRLLKGGTFSKHHSFPWISQ